MVVVALLGLRIETHGTFALVVSCIIVVTRNTTTPNFPLAKK